MFATFDQRSFLLKHRKAQNFTTSDLSLRKVIKERGSREVTSDKLGDGICVSSISNCQRISSQGMPKSARKASEKWTKLINKLISDRETQMPNKNTKSCSISISHQRKADQSRKSTLCTHERGRYQKWIETLLSLGGMASLRHFWCLPNARSRALHSETK